MRVTKRLFVYVYSDSLSPLLWGEYSNGIWKTYKQKINQRVP